MAEPITNPHDKLFKQLLGEPEHAADFVAHNLPAEVVSQLDLSTLQVVQVSFIDTQFVQSEADLLFSVTIANRPGYVYLLFEHQSSADAFMLLRMLGYMVRVWKRYQGENPDCERLPAIIPMVLFHGPRGWRGPISFQSLVDIPGASFEPYVPAFEHRLYDLSPFGKDELAGNAVVRIMGDLLGAYGRPDFAPRLKRALETLNELMGAPSFAKYLEIVFRYILQVFDMPQQELGELVTQTLRPDVKEFLMTTYEQLIQKGRQEGLQEGLQQGLQEGLQEGLQKGRQEGLQEGEQIGASRVLLRLLGKRFPGDVEQLLPLLSQLSPEQQEELSERILEARSVDEIREWLTTIRRNN